MARIEKERDISSAKEPKDKINRRTVLKRGVGAATAGFSPEISQQIRAVQDAGDDPQQGEGEPNDDKTQATLIEPGQVHGTIGPCCLPVIGDENDWFRFDVANGDEITIDFSVSPPSKAEILGPDDSVLDTEDHLPNRLSGTVEQAGTGYLHLMDPPGSANSDYTFTLNIEQANKNVEVIWAYEANNDVFYSTVNAGNVYFGKEQFRAVDANSGAERWVVEPGALAFFWNVVDSTVYLGSRDNKLCAINVDTGEIRWCFETEEMVRYPVVSDDTVYAGCYDGNVYAINTNNGKERWTFETDGIATLNPSIGSVVYAGIHGDGVYALDASTGQQRWYKEIGGNWVHAMAADGTVYVSNTMENMYALDPADGSEQWVYETQRSSLRGYTGDTLYISAVDENDRTGIFALDPADGSEQWIFDDTETYFTFLEPSQRSGYQFPDRREPQDVLYAGSYDTNVYAIDRNEGEMVWQFETDGKVHPPRYDDGVVYVGSRDSNMYALDAATGKKLWQFTTGGEVWDTPTIQDGVIYVGSRDRNVYALSA